MTDFAEYLIRYGYYLVFFFVLLEGLGMPLPTAPILLAAGALCALGVLSFWWVAAAGVIAMIAGDFVMYWLGRKMGWYLLGLLCKISLNPDSCVIRSAQTFHRRGRITLVFSKFLPGINTMAPPLAGTLRMRVPQFLLLDLLASSIYIFPFAAAGFVFSRQLSYITRRLILVNRSIGWLLLVSVAAYVAYRISVYWKERTFHEVPRVTVQQLWEKMQSATENVVVFDVRSHGYHEPNARRIKKSLRIDPESVPSMLEQLPGDKEIYLYCT